MAVDLMEQYDIRATAEYIVGRGFCRVALQFPDDLLEHSVAVTAALRVAVGERGDGLQLYVMADTSYGSCCVDEVAAAHVDAQCVVHYGHACLSQTSRLPVLFVFGKASIGVANCAMQILEIRSLKKKPILVLFGLEYAHALHDIEQEVTQSLGAQVEESGQVVFADVPCHEMEPSVSFRYISEQGGTKVGIAGECTRLDMAGCSGCQMSHKSGEDENVRGNITGPTPDLSRDFSIAEVQHVQQKSSDSRCQLRPSNCVCDHDLSLAEEARKRVTSAQEGASSKHSLGGMRWCFPGHHKMEDYAILWIGEEGPALTNVMLTYNTSEVARYDPKRNLLVADLASSSRDLMRRYYLVERAKDANMVGIVVGTLGVAGYGEAIQRVRNIVETAGKKAYTMVMGKPNPAKLANFPECDVFVLVACAQTALLDSKEYFAPLITPFEAELAFVEGRQWTGAFCLEFGKLPEFTANEFNRPLPGGGTEEDSTAMLLSGTAERALKVHSGSALAVVSSGRVNQGVKSSAEYLALRSYQGLELPNSQAVKVPSEQESDEPTVPASYGAVVGRKGRASGYQDEERTRET